VSAGIGAGASFYLTLKNSRLVVVLDAKLVVGTGGRGKLGFSVDPGAIKDLVQCVTTLIAREDFRRLAIFEETDEGSPYYYLELLLTAHIATGLSMASLVLLPIDMLERMNENAMRAENAPVIASYITGVDEGNPPEK